MAENPFDQFDQQNPFDAFDPAPPAPEPEPEPSQIIAPGMTAQQFKENVGKLKAIPDIALTTLTAGAGEIVGGVGGLITLLYGIGEEGSAERAVEVSEGVSDKLTVGPLSEPGRKTLEAVAPTLLKLERGVDDLAFSASGGDPALATAIKTSLLGGLELLPGAKGGKAGLKLGRDIRKKMQEMEKVAADQGISFRADEFGDTIVDAVKRASPAERAQNAPLLQEAVKIAHADRLKAKDAAFTAARQERLFIETNSIRKLSDHLRAELQESGFDLASKKMRPVRDALEDMKSSELGFGPQRNIPGVKRQAVNYNQIELIRRRNNVRILDTKKSAKVDTALKRINRTIDDMLYTRFNEVAISGSKAALDEWKNARQMNVRFIKDFKEEKAIANMIKQDASPEDIRKWVVGASKMNAKPGAAKTINKLKEVLGDSHPAIEGIRQDYIFELAKPLIKRKPDFASFARQYDEFITNNPSVVKALDLDRTALNDLKDFAVVQGDLPKGGKVFTPGDISSSIARLSVGHQIAKAAVRVTLTKRILDAMFGVEEAFSRQQILQDLIDVRFGEPVIPKSSPLAGQFMLGAAVTGLPEDEE